MKVIPVLDILNGVAVHAIKGNRSQYQPLKSVLSQSAEPLDVSSTFKAQGFRELYIADLDAILGRGSNSKVISLIAKQTGLELMVDAGVSDLPSAQQVLQNGAAKVIVGTETLQSLDFVKEALDAFGAEKVVVSLDLRNGAVLSKAEGLRSLTAPSLAGHLGDLGVTQLIVLDLARVGSGEGADTQLLGQLLKAGLHVLLGGGVRDIKDLTQLRDMGVYGALVATALHSGKISVADLKKAELI